MVAGLTGGIGSGKTWVGKLFSTMGIPVFNADGETKRLYDTDPVLRAELIALLGPDIYDGPRLQRKIMADRIFADKQLLKKVNDTVHPVLSKHFFDYVLQQNAPYVLMEAAVLFESGISSEMQQIITVSAPEKVRLERVTGRDAVPEETVRLRMQHQWTDEQRNAQADFVIINDGKEAVLPQVIKIHEQLLKFNSTAQQ